MTDKEFLQWVRILNEETDTDDLVAREHRQGLASLLEVGRPGPLSWTTEQYIEHAFSRIWRTAPRR